MSHQPPPPGQDPNQQPYGPQPGHYQQPPGYPPPQVPGSYLPPQPKKSRAGLVLGIVGGVLALGIVVVLVVLRPWDGGGGSTPTASDGPEDVVENFFETVNEVEADDFNEPSSAVAVIESYEPFMCAALGEELDDIISYYESDDFEEWLEDPTPEYAYEMTWSIDGSTRDGDSATVDASIEYNTIDWAAIDWEDPDLDPGAVEVIRKSDTLGIEMEREDGVWKICDRSAWLDL